MPYKPPVELKPYLSMIEWTPEGLKKTREALGLSMNDIANAMDVSYQTVKHIETANSPKPSHLVHYGLILERYYAYTKSLIPSYRYIGTNLEYSQELIETRLREYIKENPMVILPGDQIDAMVAVINEIIAHPQESVGHIKAKYNLTPSEYDMIMDLAMPFIRQHTTGMTYKQKYIDLKHDIRNTLIEDTSPTADRVRECLKRSSNT